jgi:hypothetical protein
MTSYAVPENSVSVVNKAARVILAPPRNLADEEWGEAYLAVSNWRASHAYPLFSFYMTLRRRATKVHAQAVVAQRLKRMVSIFRKLRNKPDMKLSQMQDIGGCRAILPSISNVRELEEVYRTSRWDHTWLKPKDYIVNPKEDGYRGVHLRYRYSGEGDKAVYDGLKIEIQLRTRLQHMWATALEAADTFTGQALKWNGGRAEWRRFFALMGSVFALREKCPLVPNTPTTLDEIRAEIRGLEEKHHIAGTFEGYRAIAPHIIDKSKDSAYFLVTLDPIKLTVQVKGFAKSESILANKEYTEAEKAISQESGTQVVLVSVQSVNALKRAYPNYFLDTQGFMGEVDALLKAGNTDQLDIAR